MAWLAAELDSASRASKSVWLVMHIPLGINDYNTVKDERTGSAPVEFWLPGFSRQFVGLVDKFKNTVQVAFSGHTHMDDFRVIEAELTTLVLNKLVPSISPIFRNNPGFQVYFFDRVDGVIRDYSTYYLSNLFTAGKPSGFGQVEWEREYSFDEAYKVRSLDISAIVSIARKLRTQPAIQALYTRLYSGFDGEALSVYSCAILHTTLEEFEKCQHANRGPLKKRSNSDSQ